VQDKQEPLVFGLDIGIASVGWAVLATNRIVSLGVRAFDKAETPDKGEPLNLARRTARLTRRRLRRRAWRLTRLARVLKAHGVLADAKRFRPDITPAKSPWALRVEGLVRALDADEWARVIYHLCKHRGFHWTSRADERRASEDTKGEGGRVKQGLAGTAKLMTEKGYRTAAEMVLSEFPDAQRNKRGDYTKALARALLADELRLLFDRQRQLGSRLATTDLEREILGNGDRKSGLFWQQKPALAGANLLKMLGRCTFEPTEFRAPKASFTAERHVWLTRLNNLRLFVDGVARPLNEQERLAVIRLPYEQAKPVTYQQVRAAITRHAGTPDSLRFVGLRYESRARQEGARAADPEAEKLAAVPAWQEVRQTLKKHGLETEWKGMAAAAIDGSPQLLDTIAWVLSVYKDDDEVRAELNKLALPVRDRMVEALLDIRFDKFHSLSLKALHAIVPHMERGLRYDEACQAAGYHHSERFKPGAGTQRTLPSFYAGREADGRMRLDDRMDAPRNPVVLRALNQARKVLNALVRTYGSAAEVRIEMARDLSRPLDERRQIEREQAEYRTANEGDRAHFRECFGTDPTGAEFEKWRLYREQQGKCAYSIEDIDLTRLREAGYVEIDHALPYSRSFDDSKSNKVLVLSKENRDKGNRTPFEYLGGAQESERWQRFVAYVEGNRTFRLAKRTRLLRKNFGAQEAGEFRERNLNDTRYICRFFKNYVERFLQLAENSDAKRCVVVSGQLTAFLRRRWGLTKIREESDRHHALDAAVVAACTHGMVKRLSDYARRKELAAVRSGYVDPDSGEILDSTAFAALSRHFPRPWDHFREELELRLKEDDPARLRDGITTFGTYSPEEIGDARPLFVSRAPQRRNGGPAHKDTIYAQTSQHKREGAVTQKVALTTLTVKDLDNLVEPHRNAKLYQAIRERLTAHAGKADRAFTPDNPLRKPSRDGSANGPIVRAVTLKIPKLSGIAVRGGVAKNDTMLRVDVFSKDGKFHLVPVYVYHRAVGLPDRAIVAFKDEDEWTQIDDSFRFLFSLHANDLVRVTPKKVAPLLGYFRTCDSSTGAISIALHDRNALGQGTVSRALMDKNPSRAIPNDSRGLIRGIGVKTATNLEKLQVDVLGNVFPCRPEKRRGLA
jgi:CRISPR-associated endonuclease Csn1